MECPNLSHPDNKLVISKLGENAFWSIWNQNNGIIPQFIIEQLKSDSKFDNVRPGVEELFNSNPKLANAVYSALGFDNLITPNDKIIWGHPAIGKSYAAKKVKMIDFDSYKLGINKKYNLYIAPGLSDTELRTDDKTREARENWRYESEENQALWNQFIRDVWQQAKKDAKEQGAILFASDLLVLREFGNEVDKALTMPDELFFERSKQRNNFIEGELGTKVWKGNLNRAVNNFKEKFGEDKAISTEKYLSDLFITPQQKATAQQLYSQYLKQNPNGSVEQFKSWVASNQSNVQYQLPQGRDQEEFVASEKTIRDLAARMSDRIGIPVRYISDRSQQFKGKLEKGTVDEYGYNHEQTVAVINLAYATLDTPIHEILGHPIIRAIKGDKTTLLSFNDWYKNKYGQDKSNWDSRLQEYEDYKNNQKLSKQLYQNLLKELEYGKGKEVLDRIKRDYVYKERTFQNHYVGDGFTTETTKGEIVTITKEEFEKAGEGELENRESNEYLDIVTDTININGVIYTHTYGEDTKEKFTKRELPKYTLEEQQEEAIVELLGLMTAEKLDNVKDGKLISLLKRLLKEMKAFMKQLLGQKEVEINKLPDNMTLGDIADLLAYSNSKLILPGNEVVYTTPDNQQFKTYQEASNHISELAKSVEDVDLDNVNLDTKSKKVTKKEDIPIDKFVFDKNPAYGGFDKTVYDFSKDKDFNYKEQPYERDNEGNWFIPDPFGYNNDVIGDIVKIYNAYIEGANEVDWNTGNKTLISNDNPIVDFINKNKEYEQSKEIIEEWKRTNNIRYNPEEVYSRGQGFYSAFAAYSDLDLDTLMANILQHIEDNEKAGGKFALSAFTKPIDKTIRHIEKSGLNFIIFPKPEHIMWAANTDVFSGSVWDASEKVNKDKKSELLGVSYTKYPSLQNVNSVQPNLASVIDDLAHHHNELGIQITGNNFRLEINKEVLNETDGQEYYKVKAWVDKINSILDQKYGKLVKPEIKKYQDFSLNKNYHNFNIGSDNYQIKFYNDDWELGVEKYLKNGKEISDIEYSKAQSLYQKQDTRIQPTQTNETLKESIESVSEKIGKDVYYIQLNSHLGKYVIYGSMGVRAFDENFNSEKEAQDFLDKKYPKKEYHEQALTNFRIAKLKEVAKKYPRSLIRSEVRPISNSSTISNLGFPEDELPFQKVSDNPFNQFQQSFKVNDIIKEINREKAANKNKISKSLFDRAYEVLKNAGIKFKYSTTKDGKYGIIIESHSFSDLFKEGMNMNVQTLFSKLESKGLMNNTLKLVKSKFTNNTVNIKLINSLEGHSITGNDDFNAFYDPHNNTIYLNSEKILKDKSDMQDILAEELLHAQLFQTLENNDVKAREFSDFYQFVKDKLTSIYGDKYDRVMANEHEFIAALFYDKDLQRDLNSIPSSNPGRKSFFADIWDKILNILRFKADDRSVLAEGLSRATELLEKSQNIQNDTELLPRGELPFLFNSAKDTSFYGDQLARFRDRTGKEATLAQKNTFEKALQARVGTNLDEETHTYTRNGVKFKSQSEYVSSSDPMYNSEMSEEDKDKYENNRQWGNQVDHLLCLGLIGYTKEEAIKEFKDKFPDSLLSSEVIEKVYEGMEGLLKKYKDCLFSTQQPLYNLGRKIMGTADIMVIFPDGRIKIIDIKSSIYPVGYNNGTFESYTTLTGKEGRYDKGGKTWVSKKQKHEAQLSCYKGMAEYLGFQFVDDAVSVLPVHVVPSSENPNIITDVTVEPEVKNIRVSAKFSEILKTDSEVIKNDTKGNDLIETLRLQITDRMRKLKGKSSKKAEYFKLEEFLKKDLSTMESISAAKEFIDTIHRFLVYDPEGYGTVKHAFDKFINDLEENPNEVNSLAVAKQLSEYRVLINTYEPLINQIKDLYLEMEKSGENLNENDTYKQIEAILKDFSRIKVDYNNNINKYLAIRLADEVNPEAVERLEKHIKQLEDQYNKFTPSQKEGNAGKYNRKRLEKVQAELRRKVTASGLEEELTKGAESDIPFIDFLITAAISSSNPVVAGVAKLFKRGYEEIRTKSIEIAKKFDNTFTKFKKEVGHSENNAVMYKGMFEKSKEYDKQTGELKDVMVFTQPFDYGKFNEEKDKMYKSLEGKSEEERKRIREEFKKNHCEPLSKESIVVNGVTIVKGQNELIAEREKLVREGVWTQKQFDKWLKDMHNINFMGEAYYSDVFLQPAAKYKNPKFNELVNGTNARSEMFRLLLSEYFKAQELVPNPNGFRLPAIPKSNLDFILESPKDYFKFQKERFLDYGKEDEDVYTKDEKRKDPPVLFSYFIEPENVSLDLVQSVLSYSEMAMRYEFNSENLPLALSALEQLENTPPVQTNSLGIKTEHPLAKKLNIKGWSKYLKKHNGNNAAALLEAFIDMQVLNMRQKKEEISILGRNINAGKMVNNIMGIASIVNIGGNPILSVANSLQANGQMLIESAAKEFFTDKDLAWAKYKYYDYMRLDFLKDASSGVARTKIGQLIELYDPMQGEYRDKYGNKITKKQFLRMFNTDLWFAGQWMGEHAAAVQSMLALMHSTKVKDSKGSEISLFDAYEFDKNAGKLKLKEGVLFKGKVSSNGLLAFDVQNRLHAINKRLHGVYNNFDAPTMSRFALGRLALMYRKHIGPGFKRRFKGYSLDQELGAETEGMYMTYYSTLFNQPVEFLREISPLHKSNLTDLQKANLRRTLREQTLMMLTFFIAMLLESMIEDADDDEKAKYQYVLYQALRMNQELGAYGGLGNPATGIIMPDLKGIYRSWRTPTAAYGLLENSINFLLQFGDPSATLEKDKGWLKKGDSKLKARFFNLIGIRGNNIDPDKALEMFERK